MGATQAMIWASVKVIMGASTCRCPVP